MYRVSYALMNTESKTITCEEYYTREELFEYIRKHFSRHDYSVSRTVGVRALVKSGRVIEVLCQYSAKEVWE